MSTSVENSTQGISLPFSGIQSMTCNLAHTQCGMTIHQGFLFPAQFLKFLPNLASPSIASLILCLVTFV